MFTKTQTDTKTEAKPEGNAERPGYRAWLVLDNTTGGDPIWTELTGLWPTRKGGLSGAIRKPLPQLAGFANPRLVILPAKDRPAA
ncbi:hypothetical protein HB662_28670 [Roseomonas frigidaquae]|uniref:Uncharacterized protein n=1 Tax=Falsiroseomonas frigidaquae TaxID=487318 RepID=A0ABX1F8Z3_9PROT|nr:hypothetical protein [Falsiroseomonas frigidaquae]NKE48773.1 hypothetical protein [Falsiroseomonas frigidaquae]